MTELLDPAGTPTRPGPLGQALQAIVNLILPTQRELITLLRTPTPIKVTKTFVTDANGCIGHGLDTPDPEVLYQCPASTEAWLHRISITVPDYGPSNPLETGQLLCVGSTAGEIIFFLPYHGDIAPIQIVEGHLSAPHLNSSEVAGIVGDQMPPGIRIRMDLQIILNTGLSEFTPRAFSPTNLDLAGIDELT
jgi:hypothetical protein